MQLDLDTAVHERQQAQAALKKCQEELVFAENEAQVREHVGALAWARELSCSRIIDKTQTMLDTHCLLVQQHLCICTQPCAMPICPKCLNVAVSAICANRLDSGCPSVSKVLQSVVGHRDNASCSMVDEPGIINCCIDIDIDL